MRQKSAPSERSEETERSPFCSLSLSRKTPVAFRPASFESKEQKERERGKLTLGKMGSLISFSLSLFLTRSLDEKGERRNKRTVFSLRSKGDKKLFFTVSLFSRRPASFENKRKKNSLTHSLLLFSLPSLPPPPLPPQPPQVNASPAIKRRAFWNSDYSDYPPESDYATLGREYDAQNAAVVDAYARLLQETTVRSAWKRPGCTARTCSPYTEGACSPESKECKTEAEMARKVGFVPLFGDGPSPRAEMAGKEMKA